MHRLTQATGLLMAISGFIIGIYVTEEQGAGVTYALHYRLGIAVTALLVAQVSGDLGAQGLSLFSTAMPDACKV